MSVNPPPSDLKYTKTHEWVRLHDQMVEIGITDFAQHQLSDITYVDLPELHNRFEAGEEVVVVESIKAASDIYAPVSGEIIEVNEQLANAPDLVNNDPYGKGWLFRMKPDACGDVAGLMSADEYAATLPQE
ncbi:MAG: glycine cleavage system protein GcvH [Kiritimatiellia bacterium]|nr:glycine cleavage system protein GcvH [Lentisphaerota bacterium]